MMDEAEFWRLVDQLSGSASRRNIQRLMSVLERRTPGEITGFADRLALLLYTLDRRTLADQPFADSEVKNGPVLSGSADAFLYARCAVVVAGRPTFERALNVETEFARAWDLGAERLLEVAPEAYRRATGHEWDHEETVSYETGSNSEGWDFSHDAKNTDVTNWPVESAKSLLVEVTTALSDEFPAVQRFVNHPERVEFAVVQEVSSRLTTLLLSTGGPPAGLEGVQISLLQANRWDLEAKPDGADIDLVSFPPVFVLVDGRAEHSWSNEQQDRAVLGIASYALYQVLQRRGLSAELRSALEVEIDRARDVVPFPSNGSS